MWKRPSAYFDYYDTSHRLPAYLDSVKAKAERGLAGWRPTGRRAPRAWAGASGRGEKAEANRVREDAARRHPGRADLLYWLGTARLQSGAPQAAVAALGEAVAVQPAFVEATSSAPRHWRPAGRPGEAEAAYREASGRDPIHQPQAWNNLGFLLLQAQRFDEALPLFEKATRSTPTSPSRSSTPAASYLLREQFDEAAGQFEQALAAEAGLRARSRQPRAGARRQGRYDEARTLLQKLLRLQPGDARARAMLQQVEANCSGTSTWATGASPSARSFSASSKGAWSLRTPSATFQRENPSFREVRKRSSGTSRKTSIGGRSPRRTAAPSPFGGGYVGCRFRGYRLPSGEPGDREKHCPSRGGSAAMGARLRARREEGVSLEGHHRTPSEPTRVAPGRPVR